MTVDSTDLLNKRHLHEERKDQALLSTYPALGDGESGGNGGDDDGGRGGVGGGERGGVEGEGVRGGVEGGGGGGSGEGDEMSFDDIVIYDRRKVHTNPSFLSESHTARENGRATDGDVNNGNISNGNGNGNNSECQRHHPMPITLVIVTYGNGVTTSLLAVDRFYATHPGAALVSFSFSSTLTLSFSSLSHSIATNLTFSRMLSRVKYDLNTYFNT